MSKAVLLCGIPSEPPLRLAIEAAKEAGVRHVVLNQRASHLYEFTLDVRSEGVTGSLWLGGEEWDLSAFSGVYVRLTDMTTLPEYCGTARRRPNPDHVERAASFNDRLLDWLEVTECRVANRPSAMASNLSKPYQAQVIAACGFEVPETLVTNDPDEVRSFAALHSTVVYKSTSSERSIVQPLNGEALARLDRVRALPTQFQAHVSGVDVRVHTTGARVFATEVRSRAIDYRYAHRDGVDASMDSVELSPDVVARCQRLAAALELPLSGIDLRRCGDRWTCFEVNPSPAYSWYQEMTGQPISTALVEWLSGAVA